MKPRGPVSSNAPVAQGCHRHPKQGGHFLDCQKLVAATERVDSLLWRVIEVGHTPNGRIDRPSGQPLLSVGPARLHSRRENQRGGLPSTERHAGQLRTRCATRPVTGSLATRPTGWKAALKKIREDFWLVGWVSVHPSASRCSPLREEFFYVRNTCGAQVRAVR